TSEVQAPKTRKHFKIHKIKESESEPSVEDSNVREVEIVAPTQLVVEEEVSPVSTETSGLQSKERKHIKIHKIKDQDVVSVVESPVIQGAGLISPPLQVEPVSSPSEVVVGASAILIEPAVIPKARKHFKIHKIKENETSTDVSVSREIDATEPVAVVKPESPIETVSYSYGIPVVVDAIESDPDFVESKKSLLSVAPDGWLHRFLFKLAEFSPSFDLAKFASSVSEIPSFVTIDDDLIRQELDNAGAPLSETQFDQLCAAINPAAPKTAVVAFEAITDAANHVGPKIFISRLIPSTLMPGHDELYWINKIRGSAPGDWWPRFLKKIGQYSPEFDLPLFVTKLGAISLPMITDDLIVQALSESRAKLTPTQFYHVKESIVPGKPLVATSAFRTLADAVHQIGIKSVLGGVLPGLGTWVAEKKKETVAAANLGNAAPEGWLARFLRKVSEYSPSFNVGVFASSLSDVPESSISNDVVLSKLSKAGASLSDGQYSNVLAAVNPDYPQDSVKAFKILGRSYREAEDSIVFTREILPAALAQSLTLEEQRVLDKLQKCAPTGWWSRFLDGVHHYSPAFDLTAFTNGVASIPSGTLNTDSVLEILAQAHCPLSKSELQHIEDQMAPGQYNLVASAYKNLGDAVREIGVVSFVSVVSPVLSKAEKSIKKRNRIIRIVSTKSSGPTAAKATTEIKPTDVRRDSIKEFTSVPYRPPVKRLSFAGTPEVVRTSSRGSLVPIVVRPSTDESNAVKNKSSREIKQRIPSVPEITRLPSPPMTAQELNIVKPKSSVVSFKDAEAFVEPAVAIVRTESIASLDDLYPINDKPVTRRRSTASGSTRSFDSQIDKRRSFLEYLTDTSSVSSNSRGINHTRKRLESPEDTILAMSLARQYSSVVSQGWWFRVTFYIQSLYREFDSFEFISKLSNEGPLSDDGLQAILVQAGAPVTQKEVEELKSNVNASPEIASNFLSALGPLIQSVGARRFLYKILPIWSNADTVKEISVSVGIQELTLQYPDFKPDTFTFITECQRISPSFNITKFFEAFSTVQDPLTEEKLAGVFKYAGLDAPAAEYKRLSTLLIGFWSLDALRRYGVTIYSTGVSKFVTSLSQLGIAPSQEQCNHAGMAWISSMNDIGPKAKFDPAAFVNSMRAIDPVFNLESFLSKLIVAQEINNDADIGRVFQECGLTLSDEEYKEVMIATCGSYGSHVQIFRSWWQFIRLWGIQLYFETIEKVLAEQRAKNALVRTFLGRIFALGPNVQFNLRGFVASCKAYNPDFSLQVFCDRVRSISRLEEDSLYDAFVASGIKMDRLSIEYSELQTTLFGDYHLSMTAFRELHYLLKKLGSEWSVIYMWALVDQRQQVEESVVAFKTSIQEVKVAINGETAPLRFTMRSFIEKCKNSQGWHSDADSFDLKMLLEKLSKLSNQGDIAGNLVSVFKSCGIILTVNEYESLIGSISGGDYTSGLVVFKLLIDFLKRWGMEWNMWIIWSLLDDKAHNEDEMMEFMLRVREFGPEAKFDLLQFIERCESLENSWHSESSFNIEVFISELMNLHGKLTLESIEAVYRASGIRTTTEEYKDLTITLTGGEFETTALPVVGYWIHFLHLWGAQWFLRASTSFFERVYESDREIERLDLALTATNNAIDLRSFSWYCETRNGGFNVATFLEGLINASDLTHHLVLELLAEQHIDLSDAELLNLVGLLTGADGEEGFRVLRQWILVLRTCTVKYYLFLWRLECIWKVTGVDVPLSINAFQSRIKFIAPDFNVERFVAASDAKKAGWDVLQFVEYLVRVRGELNVSQFQEAYKVTGVEVLVDETIELLSALSGNKANAVTVAREWVFAARVSGAKALLESQNAIQEAKELKGGEGWFSRVVRVVATGAETAVHVVATGAESAVHAVEDIMQ
ncbi:UNVERIFIED_CONTAM: hypothetical protein HDU68_002858, partial [Siphonaria sp. JEL0065]